MFGLVWWWWPGRGQAPAETGGQEPAVQLDSSALVVFIHPGHGGNEDGPTYPPTVTAQTDPSNIVRAKDINLQLALAVERALTKEGVKTVLSRRDDVFVDALDRQERAESAGAALSLAIYLNSQYADTKQAGWQIIDYKRADWGDDYRQRRTLAHELDLAMADRLATYGLQSGGVFTRNSTFTPDMPTLVLLPGFISNDLERTRLLDERYQWEIANAVADAVVIYRDQLRGREESPSDLPPEQPIAGTHAPF